MKTVALLLIITIALTLPNSMSTSGEAATPITHVIVIVQENHSFDNYFGTYPTANGTLVDSITSQLQPVDGIPNGTCLPYGMACLAPSRANASETENPVEGQLTYENDYDQGKMDGFAAYSGPQSMTYFDYNQIPAYWTYAEEYGLAENYFASVLSTTNPNRLLLLAGDTPVAENNGPPPFLPYNETILNQLSVQGISWGYFDFLNSIGGRNQVPAINYVSGLDSNALSQVRDVPLFFQDLSEGHLPSVSFVSAIGFDALDEHPPSNVTSGEMWVVSIVNAVMESAYWDSSAIFITYDEGGGYYDHVPPPQLLTINHGFEHALHGYGQRVPLLVISPYAKENYVSNVLLNHMSILRFIDYNWNLQLLNQNVANSNNLLGFFYFNGVPRTPIVLGGNGSYSVKSYPTPIQFPLNALPYSRNDSASSEQPWRLSATIPIAILSIVLAVVVLLRKKRLGSSRRVDGGARGIVESLRVSFPHFLV